MLGHCSLVQVVHCNLRQVQVHCSLGQGEQYMLVLEVHCSLVRVLGQVLGQVQCN